MVLVIIKTIKAAVDVSRIVGLFNSSCFLSLGRCSWSKSTEHHHCPTVSLSSLFYHNLGVDKLDYSPRIVSGAETCLDDALPMAEHVKLRQGHIRRHLNMHHTLIIMKTTKMKTRILTTSKKSKCGKMTRLVNDIKIHATGPSVLSRKYWETFVFFK